MESECNACSKGLFALAMYISDRDVLPQVLKDHKLVPATRKCPKCELVLNIDQNYNLFCTKYPNHKDRLHHFLLTAGRLYTGSVE